MSTPSVPDDSRSKRSRKHSGAIASLMAAVTMSTALVLIDAARAPLAFAEPLTFTHDESARAADSYAAWLAKNWQAARGTEREHRRAGDRLLAEGRDLPAASRAYANALTADPTSSAAWLGLARSLLATPEQQLGSTSLYTTAVNAGGAAYRAYQLAKDPKAKAESLAVLADALERRSYWRPAIDALKIAVDLGADGPIRDRYEALRAEHGFRIADYAVDNASTTPRVCVTFTETLPDDADRLAKFVALNDRDPDRISLEDQQLCVEGLNFGETYKLRLREGLPSTIGEALTKTADLAIFVPDRPSSVRFPGRTYVLPRSGQSGIPITTVNTSRVKVEIFRIGDRSLAREVADGTLSRQLNSWERDDFASRLGAKVWSGTLETKDTRNADVVTAVPIGSAVPTPEPGAYALIAHADGPLQNDDQPATQWFIVSDLGLTTITAEDGLHVFVRSLEQARPVAGTKVRLLARNNEELAVAATDAQGRAVLPAGAARGEGAMAPAVLVAETEAGDYAFLDLTQASFDLTDRGVKGRTAPGPVDAFLYSERGVYRGGETVNVTALIRNRDGAAATLPATMIVMRPDGVTHLEQQVQDQAQGGRTLAVALPDGAMTGTWRVRVHLDAKAPALAELALLVEDYLPERLELTLTSPAQPITPGEAAKIEVAGRFLYGPPASGLAIEGDVLVKPAGADPTFPGFRFGRADVLITPARSEIASGQATDDAGAASVAVGLPPIPETLRPLEAEIRLRLVEPSGRAIERKLVRPIATLAPRIGVKPLFSNDRIGDGDTARFEIIAVEGADAITDRAGVPWRLLRLERTWQWYRRDGGWMYDTAVRTSQVADGSIDVASVSPGRIEVPTQWGRYRLEVGDAASLTTVEFEAGWYGSSDADSPEVLDVAAAKERYAAGEMAQINVTTRSGGFATVAVLGSQVHDVKTVELPSGRSTIDVPVSAEWGPGAYAMVMLHRPMDVRQKRMPSRALGVAWIGRDVSEQLIEVKLDAPERLRSASTLEVPIEVRGLKQGERAHVTVAAVDVGILNLTRFKAPAPGDHFHAQRKLGAELRDLYDRLIDGMNADAGALRSGGDIDQGLAIEGAPTAAETVSLFTGILAADRDGKLVARFEMPEFNGQVRLMAVAWSDTGTGHATRDVTVADPVAMTLAAPRFLAVGDTATFGVDLHNIDGAEGTYRVVATINDEGGPVSTLIDETRSLVAGARSRVVATVTPAATGRSTITVVTTGPNDLTVKRTLAVPVVAASDDVTTRETITLAPGQTLTVAQDRLNGFVAGSATIAIASGARAAFDVPGVLAALDRYPYGCTEQTISRALPLLYANDLSQRFGLAEDAAIKGRIEAALASVYARQNGSGAFGVWAPFSDSLWLTAYAVDFLARARDAGFAVDARRMTQALDRLANTVAYTQEVSDGGHDLAYALYALARNGRAPSSEIRYYTEAKLEAFTSPLAKAHLAADLAMIGDDARARTTFAAAMVAAEATDDGPVTRVDFGSRLRDVAALTALASEARLTDLVAELAPRIGSAYSSRARTSTQEQAWLLLAARALTASDRTSSFRIGSDAVTGGLSLVRSSADLASAPLTITNTASTPQVISLTGIGASAAPLPEAQQGLTVRRQVFRLDGTELDWSATPTARRALEQNDRVVVVMTVTAQGDGGRLLLVDRLPAGLEIENPKLATGASLKAFPWLASTIVPEHTEFRDDRFVAAFDLFRGQQDEIRVAYVARAVTPGTYRYPGAMIEDMYAPERFARTASGDLEITARR